MKVIDRYIGTTVLAGTGIAILVIVALGSFFDILKEVDDIGKGNYSMAEAIIFIALTTPTRVYEFAAMAVLLGGIVGLGVLASNSELTVMRASGLSLLRIIASVMKAGLVIMVLVTLLGEFVVPPSEQYATSRRSIALSGYIALKTQHGFWARDGLSYINIRTVKPGGVIGDIYIYEFDDARRLRVATYAREAIYQNDKWLLQQIAQTRLTEQGAEVRRIPRAEWGTLLSPQLINVVVVDPDRLSILDLRRYITYLHNNNQSADRYELAFWIKVLSPVSVAVMLLLAIPFVFGSLRSVGIGQRVLVGFLVGLVFFLLHQTFSHLGLAYDLDPFMSAATPTLVFLIAAVVMVRRVA